MIDRWDALSFTGSGLLGGGVWWNWGPGWACMLWGLVLLGIAGLHAAREGRA